jgi:hypothetical protein
MAEQRRQVTPVEKALRDLEDYSRAILKSRRARLLPVVTPLDAVTPDPGHQRVAAENRTEILGFLDRCARFAEAAGIEPLSLQNRDANWLDPLWAGSDSPDAFSIWVREDPRRTFAMLRALANPLAKVHTAFVSQVEGQWPDRTWLKETLRQIMAKAEQVAKSQTIPQGAEGKTPGERPVRTAKAKTTSKKHGTVNQRMAAMVTEDPDRVGWPASKWAHVLDCTSAAVKQTETWKKTIMGARALKEAKKAGSGR